MSAAASAGALLIGNPELERNVWIECVGLRLLAAVAAPVLIFLLIVDSADWPRSLFIVAHYIIVMAVALWGARKTADAVASEIRDRTWDQQRLSGLGPAAMTIGKVLGAPSLVWVVIGACVAAQAVALSAGAGGRDDAMAPLIFGYPIDGMAIAAEVAGAFLIFAAAFFAGLLALNGQDRPRAFDTTLFQLAGVLSAMATLTVVSLAQVIAAAQTWSAERGDAPPTAFDPRLFDVAVWWGISAPASAAIALSFVAFGAWALYGGVHQMRRAFAMRTTALGWIGFLGFLAVYLAGWAPGYWALAAAVGTSIAVYAAALFEPHRLAGYRDWLRGLRRFEPSALISAPAWLYAWLLAAALAWIAFARSDLDWVALEGETAELFAPAAAIAAGVLFLLRDVGVCVWAGLRSADGRGLWTAVLVLAFLHLVLGPLLGVLTDVAALQYFLPLNAASAVSAAAQAAAIWALAAREMATPVRGPTSTAAVSTAA